MLCMTPYLPLIPPEILQWSHFELNNKTSSWSAVGSTVIVKQQLKPLTVGKMGIHHLLVVRYPEAESSLLSVTTHTHSG